MKDYINEIKTAVCNNRRGYCPSGNYASQCGHPCERFLVYCRTEWDKKALPEVGLMMIFEDGNLHETSILRTLSQVGQVTEQQRPFEIKPINLRGKIDCMVDGIPCEIKSLNRFNFDSINSVEDILNHDRHYIRGYVAQMMMYLLMAEKEEGILILKNKDTAELKQIPIKLDYGYAEQIYKKMERVEASIKDGSLPDRITDRSVCKYCDFRHLCMPDESDDCIVVETDDNIIKMLDEFSALKPFATRCEQLNDRLKEEWKKKTLGEYLYGGKYSVQVKTMTRTEYDIPKDLKEQYKTKKEYIIGKVVNLNEKVEE